MKLKLMAGAAIAAFLSASAANAQETGWYAAFDLGWDNPGPWKTYSSSNVAVTTLIDPDGNPLNWDWTALEPLASDWLSESGRAIATAIISTWAVLELDIVVVDGVMPRPVVERLLAEVHRHLDLLPSFTGKRPDVVMGRNGASAAATGAAQLVLFHRYFSRGWNMFTA